MADPWIYYMTITKFKVNRETGQVESQGGFTKILDATQNVTKKAKAKTKAKKSQPIELFSEGSKEVVL